MASPPQAEPASESRGHTVASYFDAFAPVPAWDELAAWPPDVFALANLLLDHSEAYRFAVAPPAGRSWPPGPGWGAEVEEAAARWRAACSDGGADLPQLVRRSWAVASRSRDVPLARLRSGDPWELVTALLTLHALADEACAGVAAAAGARVGVFEERARSRLRDAGSLSRVSPARVRIIPKTRFSTSGITIRSLSRYLALCYESVEVRWQPAAAGRAAASGARVIVLLPWPLTVESCAFRPARPELLANMDPDVFGFFEYAPDDALDCELVDALLGEAVAEAGGVDAVILPEAAVRPAAIPLLESVLARHGVGYLVAGVHEPAPPGGPWGRNYLHFGVRADAGWERHEQDKHHRWRLDDAQIRQYHLCGSLPPRRLWWEAIDIRERTLHVIDLGGGITTTPLVCEDLARLDEVADLVRRIGPALVVAVLLDGPQLAGRWPCRYSGILADDPDSAVLTLSSLGMVTRSRPPGRPRSRVVAHWNDRSGGLREIELARGAAGVLLSASVEGSTLWTADGRRHREVPRLRLDEVRQLRARRRLSPRSP